MRSWRKMELWSQRKEIGSISREIDDSIRFVNVECRTFASARMCHVSADEAKERASRQFKPYWIIAFRSTNN
jgi:hypothetical protein